jgi:predicted Zn-dependent protease
MDRYRSLPEATEPVGTARSRAAPWDFRVSVIEAHPSSGRLVAVLARGQVGTLVAKHRE